MNNNISVLYNGKRYQNKKPIYTHIVSTRPTASLPSRACPGYGLTNFFLAIVAGAWEQAKGAVLSKYDLNELM